MNSKNNYSPALQEGARRFEVRLNGGGDISSFGTTVRNKRPVQRLGGGGGDVTDLSPFWEETARE